MLSAKVSLSLTALGLKPKIEALAVEFPEYKEALCQSRLLTVANEVNAGNFDLSGLDIETKMWFLHVLKSHSPLQIMIDSLDLPSEVYNRMHYGAYFLDKGMATARTFSDYALVCPTVSKQT